ncbi:MAG: hypothetical protein ACMUIG_04820 [Thermoplasmatota archaeon]
MASDDKKHAKRLKEADKIFQKQYKLLRTGKITKDQFKERIKPYKEELIELGYPIKSSKKEEPAEEPKAEPVETVEPVEIEKGEKSSPGRISVNSWEKRSSLTVEEIEMRIDELALGRNPSDGLRALYEAKFGEELEPPTELVHFTMPEEPESDNTEYAGTEEEEPSESQEIVETEKKKGFLKSVFKKRG